MTFEEWFIKEYHVNVNKDTEYKNTDTYDISEYAWNAAVGAVLSDLQAKVHINTYNVTNIDYDEATRVCTRLLSISS